MPESSNASVRGARRRSRLQLRRRRAVAAVAVGAAVLGLISIGTSGAYLTGATSASGSTAPSGTGATVGAFAPVTTTATKAAANGQTSGTRSTVTWSDAGDLDWAKKSGTPSTDMSYTVKRSLVNSFGPSAVTTPIPVSSVTRATDPGTSLSSYTMTDTVPGGPANSAVKATQVVATPRGDGMFAIVGGKVYRWGTVWRGETNDSSTQWFSSSTPTEITGFTRPVVQITAGKEHMCALQDDATVMCAGFNSRGQLGNLTSNATAVQATAVALTDPNNIFVNNPITRIDAGEYFTCALTTIGTVACWGDNTYGQIGNPQVASGVDANGANVFFNAPIRVRFQGGAVAWENAAVRPALLAAGNYSACVVLSDGSSTYCWGRNNWNQLGKAAIAEINNYPVAIVDDNGLLSGVTRLDGGHAVFCVVYSSSVATTKGLSNVACWGGGGLGVLGDGASSTATVPTAITSTERGFTDVSVGISHACASVASRLTCWGRNDAGQLGTGRRDTGASDYMLPRTRDLSSTLGAGAVASIGLGWSNTCVTNEYGSAACWGNSTKANGQLVDDVMPNPAPVWFTSTQMLRPPIVTSSQDGYWSVAALADGRVVTWGRSENSFYDNLNAGAISGFPKDIVQITMGAEHICVLTSQNKVWCVGRGTLGQLGNGGAATTSTPVQVTGTAWTDKYISKLDALKDGACVLVRSWDTSTGTPATVTPASQVACWGNNDVAQLGIAPGSPNNIPYMTVPRLVGPAGGGSYAALTGVVDIAVGSDYVCALKSVQVACWGSRVEGQTGNGTMDGYNPTPVDIRDNDNVLAGGIKALDAGYHTSCLILASGAPYCWGRGTWGVLGDGTTTNRIDLKPVLANAGVTLPPLSRITLSTRVSCAWTEASGATPSAMYCWGFNDDGALGAGNYTASTNKAVAVTDVNNVFKSGVATAGAGWLHMCAASNLGAIACWGNGGAGRTGQGNQTNLNVPTTVLITGARKEDAGLTCDAGASVIANTTVCTLSPTSTYYYEVTYRVNGIDKWVSTGGVGTRAG